MYTYCSQYRDAGRAEVLNIMGQKWMPGAKEVFPHAILDMRAVGLADLIQKFSEF
jgi:hypothetical protein